MDCCFWTIAVPNLLAAASTANNADKKVIFKNCVCFTDCISKTNNIQVDDAKGIDVAIPMYYLIEYSDNYLKTSGGLC